MKRLKIIIRKNVFDFCKNNLNADFQNDYIIGLGSKYGLKQKTIEFCDDLSCKIVKEQNEIFVDKKLFHELMEKIKSIPKNSVLEICWTKEKIKSILPYLIDSNIIFEINPASDIYCSLLIVKN
jgi:hypothetical protein